MWALMLGGAMILALPVESGFEQGDDGWTLQLNRGALATMAVDDSTAATGQKSLKVTIERLCAPDDRAATTNVHLRHGPHHLEAGKYYQLRFWAKAPEPQRSVVVRMLLADQSGYVDGSLTKFTVGTTWQSYRHRCQAPEGVEAIVQIQCGAQDSPVWFDNIVFGAVSEPCPLRPADRLWADDVLFPLPVWKADGQDRWVDHELPSDFTLDTQIESAGGPVTLLFRRADGPPVTATLGPDACALRAGDEVLAKGPGVDQPAADEALPIAVTRYRRRLVVEANGGPAVEADVPGTITNAGTRDVDPTAVWTFEARLLLPPDHVEGGHEATAYQDPTTGVTVRRLTRSPRHDKHSYYDVSPWSPDGKRLVFTSAEPGARASEIWIMNADGSGRKRVATNGTFSMHTGAFPQWGADNHTVYYTGRPDEGPTGAIAVNVDNGETRIMGPSSRMISPDGKRSLYGQKGDGKYPDLAIVNTDGTGGKVIARLNDVIALSPEQEAAKANPPNLTNYKWAPDGKTILFGLVNTSRPGPPLKELYTVKPDGSNLRYLCPYNHHHIWVPDSRRVLFNGKEAMMIINADGTGLRPIAPLSSGHPSFSPDSRFIVTDVYGGAWGPCLVLINAATGEVRKLVNVPSALGYTHEEGTHYHPVWSRDGQQILYDSDQTGTCQLYVLDLPKWDDLPAGQPDETKTWQLQLNRGAQALFRPDTSTAASGQRSMRVLIQRLCSPADQAFPTNIHLFYITTFKPGHKYRFSAALRAREEKRPVTLQLRTVGGSSQTFEVGPKWQVYTTEFDGPDQELEERLQVLFATGRAPVWVDDLKLEEDGKVILSEGFEEKDR